MTLPDEQMYDEDTRPLSAGNDSPVRYTQADRDRIIDDVLHHGFGGIFRKHSRIVAVQENEPFEVETDRGVMRGAAGDWIVTNHPEDDDGSDVWSISNDRMESTYHPWDRPVITNVEVTSPVVRIRSVIAELNASGEDRHAVNAIAKLEEAILHLYGLTVLGE